MAMLCMHMPKGSACNPLGATVDYNTAPLCISNYLFIYLFETLD